MPVFTIQLNKAEILSRTSMSMFVEWFSSDGWTKRETIPMFPETLTISYPRLERSKSICMASSRFVSNMKYDVLSSVSRTHMSSSVDGNSTYPHFFAFLTAMSISFVKCFINHSWGEVQVTTTLQLKFLQFVGNLELICNLSQIMWEGFHEPLFKYCHF